MQTKDEEIYKKIEEIYNTEKGKPFIIHLVRSFLPINRSTFMLSNSKNKKMKCAVMGTPLVSKDELFKFNVENVDEIFKNISDRLLGKTTQNIVVDNFKGKLFAIECEKSDKVVCLQVVQQLYNFTCTELLKGNKNIEFVLKDEQRKELAKYSSKEESFVEKPNQVKSDEPKSKIAVFEQKKAFADRNKSNSPSVNSQNNESKKPEVVHSTTSLGDFSSLQKLKEQMESKGL
jgi:hypothetical protein